MRSPKVRSIQVQPNTRGKVAFLQLDCPVLPKVVFRFPSSGKGDTREVSVPAFEIVAHKFDELLVILLTSVKRAVPVAINSPIELVELKRI